jgi:hypothetical protein
MTDTEPPDDALVPQIRVIEDQPLATRAEAYVQLHEQLREALEGGDLRREGDRSQRG